MLGLHIELSGIRKRILYISNALAHYQTNTLQTDWSGHLIQSEQRRGLKLGLRLALPSVWL